MNTGLMRLQHPFKGNHATPNQAINMGLEDLRANLAHDYNEYVVQSKDDPQSLQKLIDKWDASFKATADPDHPFHAHSPEDAINNAIKASPKPPGWFDQMLKDIYENMIRGALFLLSLYEGDSLASASEFLTEEIPKDLTAQDHFDKVKQARTDLNSALDTYGEQIAQNSDKNQGTSDRNQAEEKDEFELNGPST